MTSAVTWFELGQKVAESHARNATDSVSVIPIVVEDLRAARPILIALAEMHEGCFLDASDIGADPGHRSNVHGPVPGTSDPVRRHAIKLAFADLPKPVEIVDKDDELLDVEFTKSTAGMELSTGDRMLHAILRAAAHRDLEELSFAVIAYPSGPLDERVKKAAWDLMMRHVDGAPRKAPQTLVVAVESDISIEIHCETDYGFRFAIEQGQLLHRRKANHLHVAAKEIVDRSNAFPIVLFLGAGFSVSSRIPLGDELRDNAILRMLDEPGFAELDPISLGIEFHEFLYSMGGTPDWLSTAEKSMNSREFARALTLQRVLEAEKRMWPELPTLVEFKERHDQVVQTPGPSVEILAELLHAVDAKVIVLQLNFDCLVERNATSAVEVFASAEDFGEAPDYIRRYWTGSEARAPLLKLHGTIESFDTCVITQDQTERGVGERQLKTLYALLDLVNDPLPWIYVGASMRDRDLLQVLTAQQFAQQLDERWVVPYLVPSIRAFATPRVAYWAGTGRATLEDRVIAETSDAFFNALRASWLPN